MDEHPVRRWRRAHGVTQDVLAAAVGIKGPSIHFIEHRRNGMKDETLRALVAATERLRPGHGLTAGQILGTESYESQSPHDGEATAPPAEPCTCGRAAAGAAEDCASGDGAQDSSTAATADAGESGGQTTAIDQDDDAQTTANDQDAAAAAEEAA